MKIDAIIASEGEATKGMSRFDRFTEQFYFFSRSMTKRQSNNVRDRSSALSPECVKRNIIQMKQMNT